MLQNEFVAKMSVNVHFIGQQVLKYDVDEFGFDYLVDIMGGLH